jgi:translation elongation factor EF-Tu-like GTPase
MQYNGEKIDVTVNFLTEAEGGRTDVNPACLNGNVYRPHFVSEHDAANMIGVMFESGPDKAFPGLDWEATALVLFQPRKLLEPGTRFSIKEGRKTVANGVVRGWPD